MYLHFYVIYVFRFFITSVNVCFYQVTKLVSKFDTSARSVNKLLRRLGEDGLIDFRGKAKDAMFISVLPEPVGNRLLTNAKLILAQFPLPFTDLYLSMVENSSGRAPTATITKSSEASMVFWHETGCGVFLYVYLYQVIRVCWKKSIVPPTVIPLVI